MHLEKLVAHLTDEKTKKKVVCFHFQKNLEMKGVFNHYCCH